jgi:hypothetical protein
MLLAGCPANQPEDSEQEFPPPAELRLSIEPSRLVARQNSSVVLHVDTPDAAEDDLPAGYAFDLDEVVGHIDVTTAPCPPGTGSRACQDWTITPRAGSLPGTYFVNVETVGSRAGRTDESFWLTVVADPPPDYGPAVRVAGNANFSTVVLNTEHEAFVTGQPYHRNAPPPGMAGYRRLAFPVDTLGAFQDLGFEPGEVNEFVPMRLPEDARWIGVAGESELFAVRDDGTVWTLQGESSGPVSGLTNVVVVVPSLSNEHPHLALQADGKVIQFGTIRLRNNGDDGQHPIVYQTLEPGPFCEEQESIFYGAPCTREITNVRSLATLYQHSLFLKQDGTVWGGEFVEAAVIADAPSPARAVALTWSFDVIVRVVLSTDGTVWTSASRHFSRFEPFAQVAGLSDVIAIDPDPRSDKSEVNALRRDGTVWSLKADGSGAPAQITGLTDVIGLAAGHALQGPCPGGGGRLWVIRALSAERLHGFGENCGNTPRISISVSVNGQGRIVSEPASIDCPAGLCRFFFARDSRVRLLPAPARGWAFASWTGDPDCVAINQSIDSSANFSRDLDCIATFREGGERRLAVQLDGEGSVASTPAGIDCGRDCSESYELDTPVQLAATPALGYRFDRFVGHADCSDGSLTMSAVRTCAARFATLPTPAAPAGFTASAESNAVVLRWDAVNGPVVRYSLERAEAGEFTVLLQNIPGTLAELRDGSAVSGARYTYRLTAHNLNGASPAVSVTIGELGPPVAVRTLAVRISNSGDGRITTQPAGIDCTRTAGANDTCARNFADGTSVQLIATPDAGFRFSEWRGDVDCVDGQVTLTANRQCEAVFESDAATFFLQFVPANIVGAGRVETDDLHIVCPIGDCGAFYVSGSLVRVRAVPDANALLEAWTGDCASFPATQTTIQFAITRNMSCGAVFATRGP